MTVTLLEQPAQPKLSKFASEHRAALAWRQFGEEARQIAQARSSPRPEEKLYSVLQRLAGDPTLHVRHLKLAAWLSAHAPKHFKRICAGKPPGLRPTFRTFLHQAAL